MDDEPLPDLGALVTLDERLREQALSRTAVDAAIARAERALATARAAGDRAGELRALGYLGNACRVSGRPLEATRWLAQAVALARIHRDARAEATNRIRLGEALRYLDRHAEAEAQLRRALAAADAPQAPPALRALTSFALQHLGKCLLDQSRTAEAVDVLEHALVLRKAEGDPSLIASTRQALERARAAGSPPAPRVR